MRARFWGMHSQDLLELSRLTIVSDDDLRKSRGGAAPGAGGMPVPAVSTGIVEQGGVPRNLKVPPLLGSGHTAGTAVRFA
jgi:hypothetical protein